MVKGIAGPPVRPNLLLDQPLPVSADLVWVSDITYLSLANGEWAYLGSCFEELDGLILAPNCGLAGR